MSDIEGNAGHRNGRSCVTDWVDRTDVETVLSTGRHGLPVDVITGPPNVVTGPFNVITGLDPVICRRTCRDR
jgi:hypothetical protein